MKIIKRYIYIWFLMSRGVFLVNTRKKLGFFIFFVGKILRFFLLFLFLSYVIRGSGNLAGYNEKQVIFFYLTFVFIDALVQVLFRNVYTFRPLVVSGGFDLMLVKPVNALFRVLLGGIDMIDIATMPLFLGLLIWWGLGLHPAGVNVILYILLIINGLVIAMAFHIFVVSIGIITLEIDHLIMIYRDIESMGRFPVDIYREPLKTILTFIVPIGIMITFPAKILMGISPWYMVIISFFIAGFFLYISLRFWKYALKRYTSASS